MTTPTDPLLVEHLTAAVLVTEQVVAGMRPDQRDGPTPCPDYDVAQLVDHLVGFAASFADRANGVSPAADPTSTTAGPDPVAAYRAQATRLVEGYGGDGPSEGAVPIGIALIETIAHGWDLATATNQPARYADAAVEAALAAGQSMMSPQFRGPTKSFGVEVRVPPTAPALDRLVGFMGRDPGWRRPD